MMVPGGSREKTTQASKATLLGAVGVTALAAVGLLAPAVARDGQVQEAWKDAPLVLAQEGAQTPPRQQRFDISSQPLASALTSFGRQSGLQISVDGALVRDLDSPGVSGAMTPRQALAQLLAGTGLTFRFTAPDTVMLLGPRTAAGDGPIRTGPVTVQARADADPSDKPFKTPGSSAYISREQIERIQPSSPGDIFIETPGVLSGSNHNGPQIDVNIRNAQGFNRVRVMIEGTQQDHSTYRGYAGADNRTYIDPELIGGVEITKGPGGGAYSSGTTGGIVNIRLLEAADLIREGRSTGFRMRGGLGGNAVAPRNLPENFGDIIFFPRDADTGLLEDRNDILTEDNWFASFAGAYTTDRFDLVAAYSRRKEGNYFAGRRGPETFSFLLERQPGEVEEREADFTPVDPGQEVPNTSDDSKSLLFKGTLRLGHGQSVEAGYTWYDSRFGQAFPSNIRFWPLQQFDLTSIDSHRYWLRYKWQNESDLIDFQANLWGSNSDEFVKLNGTPTQTDSWGVEVWNASLLDTRIGDLALNYGVEYSHTDMRQEGERGGALSLFSNGDRDVFGSYLNAVLAPKDWLLLEAGVRYDAFDSEGVSINADCGFTQLQDGECDSVSNSADGFSPRFGITVEPRDGLQLFAQYAQGLRGASIVETAAPTFSPIFPNPDLKPERLRSWEAGVNYVRDGLFFEGDAFRFKAVYFSNDYENYIARDFSGISSFSFQFTNLDKAKLSGYELTASYDAGVVFADLTFAYFNDAEFCDADSFDGNFGCQPFPPFGENLVDFGQPEYSGTVVVGTRLLQQRLVLGGRVNFFGENVIPIPQVNAFNVPSFWAADEIIDLFGSYSFNDNLSVAFSVENLTDRFYMTPLFQADIPAPGRTVRINTTLRF